MSGTPRAPVIPTTMGVGMLSPGFPFVDPGGVLSPVAYRFLFKLWECLSETMAAYPTAAAAGAHAEQAALAQQVADLAERVAALEARP